MQVVKGHLYALDEHFRRFLNSAAMAGISLSMTQAQMYRAIMETAAASEKMDCASLLGLQPSVSSWLQARAAPLDYQELSLPANDAAGAVFSLASGLLVQVPMPS